MRSLVLPCIVLVVAALAIGPVPAADRESAPLYTSEDLDRMFGPVPPGPSVPVDKTRPEDWHWVEQFLDREYARIDAERQHELNRREYEASNARVEDSSRIYGSMIWGGYYGGGYYGGGYWNGGDQRYPARGGSIACNGPRNGLAWSGNGVRAGDGRFGSPGRGMARQGAGRTGGHGGRAGNGGHGGHGGRIR